MTNFSVLISIYSKENPIYLTASLNSIINQTMVPNEIVLVKDGPITDELNQVIDFFDIKYPKLFKIITLPENKGLGNALSIGILECSYDIIARMDTDDICNHYRFEKQLKFLESNLDVDLVGSNIEEFNITPGDLNRFRIMPEKGTAIMKYSKYRNPVNHPSVMFRKSKVLAAGNYKSDILFFEDFSLFIRMLQNGSKFYNLQENLLYFRTGLGIDVIKRRSGWLYLKNEWKYSLLSLRIKNLNYLEWFFYVITKLPLRLLPPFFILFIYNKLLRD